MNKIFSGLGYVLSIAISTGCVGEEDSSTQAGDRTLETELGPVDLVVLEASPAPSSPTAPSIEADRVTLGAMELDGGEQVYVLAASDFWSQHDPSVLRELADLLGGAWLTGYVPETATKDDGLLQCSDRPCFDQDWMCEPNCGRCISTWDGGWCTPGE